METVHLHVEYSLEEQFEACCDIVRAGIDYAPQAVHLTKLAYQVVFGSSHLPLPANPAELLTLNALYKQATVGPCPYEKPPGTTEQSLGFVKQMVPFPLSLMPIPWSMGFKLVDRFRWEAWRRLAEMDKKEAMERYVAGFIEKIDYCAEIYDWDEMLGLFSKEYDLFAPKLRDKFRIIDRELILEDGTKVRNQRPPSFKFATGVMSYTPNLDKSKELKDVGDEKYSLEERYKACVEIIQSLPKKGPVPSTFVEMQTMYALYKQITEGPCDTSQPHIWNPEARYKWEAWNRLGDMSKEEAMEIYIACVLEKVDYCAELWDWDEMLRKHAKDYDKLEPILREKFRIIDRELIKADGTKVKHHRQSRSNTVQSRMSNDDEAPNDPMSDTEYCDARDDWSVTSHQDYSSERNVPFKTKLAKMDSEITSIKNLLKTLSTASETRHASIMKILKGAFPSLLSLRSLFYLLVWPLIIHWAIKYFGGPKIKAIKRN